MNKKYFNIVFSFVMLTILLSCKNVFSLTAIIKTNDALNVRSGPGSNFSIVGALSNGTEVSVINDNVTGKTACKKWYQIKMPDPYSDSTNAYVCSNYALIYYDNSCDDVTDPYQLELCNKGFYKSYLPFLSDLHNKYPNWLFEPIKTGLKFSDVLDNEDIGSKSLIWYDSPEGYRSTESGTYDYLTDQFFRDKKETKWYRANRETIAYYLDSRNFLNKKRIWQFERLNYSSSYHTKNIIINMLGKSFMPNLYETYINSIKTKENSTTIISEIVNDNLSNMKDEDINIVSSDYANAFLKAAMKNDISPVQMISRMIQEVGLNGGTATNGNEWTHNGITASGYYNFFNIGASGSTTPALDGLVCAYGGINGTDTSYFKPWNSPYKAIIGGSMFLSDGYLSRGQYTSYFQKWDVSPTSTTIYTHQYMQNIAAPYSESSKSWTAYNDAGLLNSSFVFAIPVYNEMNSNNYSLPNPGNPNNWLKYIKIDDVNLDDFNNEVNEYTISIPSNKTSLTITTETINSNASTSGFGLITGINNNVGEIKTLNFKVTAQNGDVKTFKINIKKHYVATDINCLDLTYNGSEQTLTNMSNGVSISNNLRTNVGSQNVQINTDTNYKFSDGTTSKSLSCSIKKNNISVTKVNYSGNYDGLEKTFNLITNPNKNISIYYSEEILTSDNYLSGSTIKPTKINAGTTTIYYYIKDNSGNYNDYASNEKDDNAIIKIDKLSIDIPNNSLCIDRTYNGTSWTLIDIPDSSGWTLDKNIGTLAGNYELMSNVDQNHIWNDGTLTTKKIICSIKKQDPVKIMSSTSGSVVVGGKTTLMVKANVDGVWNITDNSGKIKLTVSTTGEIKANEEVNVNIEGLFFGSTQLDLLFIPKESSNYNNINTTYSLIIYNIGDVPTINDVMDNIDISYNNDFTYGINRGTITNEIIQMVNSYSNKVLAVLKDKNNNVKVNKIIATGDKLVIDNGLESKSYDIIIKGDSSGDGDISILDLLSIQKKLLNVTDLTGAYFKAGDIDEDGEITILDLLKIQKHILGIIDIS